jgi:segregation and condensation protein B
MTDMSNLSTQIEGLLFAQGGAMSRAKLLKATSATPEALEESIQTLKQRTGGITLVDDGVEVELRASTEASALIEHVRKEEYSREVGRAGLEVLAAVLYRGARTRAEIDFMRGVNSSQTLRTLCSRGLIRKTANPGDERSFLYEPATELFAALGVVHRSDLPEYATVEQKLVDLETSYHAVAEN